MTHISEENSSFAVSLLRDEDLSSSLDVLYGGLWISKLQFLIKKYIKKIPAVNLFQLLVVKTLDLELDLDPHWDPNPDPQLEKMPDL